MADIATTGTAAAAQTNEPLIRVEGLRKSFGSLEVLKGIDLSVNPGEVVTIIGASGSGKSTLGRVLCGLLRPDSGKVLLNGTPLYGRHTPEELARIRNRISIVFQDYTTSVNPRFRVSTILHESFRALRRAGRTISAEEEYLSLIHI